MTEVTALVCQQRAPLGTVELAQHARGDSDASRALWHRNGNDDTASTTDSSPPPIWPASRNAATVARVRAGSVQTLPANSAVSKARALTATGC
jgi:hypothetical protein